MTLPTGTEAAVTTAKIVVVLDHLKNNRIEYLILVAIGHLMARPLPEMVNLCVTVTRTKGSLQRSLFEHH